jgi:TRAP-type C4-dicarboxylate transport system permease small subunit
MTLLRVVAVLIALGLTILLGMQGYVDWQGTERDPYATDPSKMWSFISMLARIAIGLILVAAAAFLGRRTRRARAPAP